MFAAEPETDLPPIVREEANKTLRWLLGHHRLRVESTKPVRRSPKEAVRNVLGIHWK
jgi:hypothetical protein